MNLQGLCELGGRLTVFFFSKGHDETRFMITSKTLKSAKTGGIWMGKSSKYMGYVPKIHVLVAKSLTSPHAKQQPIFQAKMCRGTTMSTQLKHVVISLPANNTFHPESSGRTNYICLWLWVLQNSIKKTGVHIKIVRSYGDVNLSEHAIVHIYIYIQYIYIDTHIYIYI